MKLRLLCTMVLAGTFVACGAKQPLNVVIVTFDATRADRIGCYGKEGAHTPNLDQLAAEGVLFEQCRSAAPITMPSHSTMMTGTYPNIHGVRDNGLFVLPSGALTLAEILGGQGYVTAAAIGSFVLDHQFGISQGFDHYDDAVTRRYENYWGERLRPKRDLFFDERPAQQVNDAILPWLRKHADEPFFIWAHYWDPHHPHIPPAPYDQIMATDLYQAEIANADEAFGRLMEELEAVGVKERTVVVFVSDHGEGEGEHNEDTHSLLCYDTTLHVPLIIRMPGALPGKRVHTMVGTIDIMPTVLHSLGIQIPQNVQGRNLLPLMTGNDQEETTFRPLYAETLSPRMSHGWGELRSWFEGGMKYIHGPRPELFDLRSDPLELHDLIDTKPDVADAMKSHLAGYLEKNTDAAVGNASQTADRETLERLEALGYVSESGEAPGTVIDELRSDGPPPQDHVGEINKRSLIKNYLSKGDYLSAKEVCLDVLEVDPENSYFKMMAAWAYLGMGQIEVAVELVEKLPQILGIHTGFVFRVAAAAAAAGEYQRAITLIDRSLATKLDAGGLALRAEICRTMDNPQGYVNGLRQALEVDERYVPARIALAVVLAQENRFEEAATELRTAITHDPLNARSHFNYGRLLIDMGHVSEARTHLERAIELNRVYWPPYLALMAIDVDMGAAERASATYERLTEVCSDDSVLFQADILLTKGP